MNTMALIRFTIALAVSLAAFVTFSSWMTLTRGGAPAIVGWVDMALIFGAGLGLVGLAALALRAGIAGQVRRASLKFAI